jgi:NDP-sugar pyrophosphorylase family protein
MIAIETFCSNFPTWIDQERKAPWEIINGLEAILDDRLLTLTQDYIINGTVAIHKTATIEQGVSFKGRIIISENCFIAANAYLRGPVFLGSGVKIGPACEIKQSIILNNSATAHFNYIGNSLIGANVNFEAGSICANHFNERKDKRIFVMHKNQPMDTKSEKFGALVGDDTKVGANAVLSPGTILHKGSIVKRLELIEQRKI